MAGRKDKKATKTITISEFCGLKSRLVDPDLLDPKVGDKFILGDDSVHKEQCKHLNLGDLVIYILVTGVTKNPLRINMTTEQAIIVENPVHQNTDGKWYYWDECWAFKEGPFETEQKCKDALDKYYKKLLEKTDE
jgi:hypothetical protein